MHRLIFMFFYKTLMSFVDDYHPMARRMMAMGFKRAPFSQRYYSPLYHQKFRLVGTFTAPLTADPALRIVIDVYSDLFQVNLRDSYHEPQWLMTCSFGDDKRFRGLHGTRSVTPTPFVLEEMPEVLVRLIQIPSATALLFKKMREPLPVEPQPTDKAPS